MIKADQPDCFDHTKLVVAVSSAADGQMQLGWHESDQEVATNRQRFLATSEIETGKLALVKVEYQPEANYDIIKVVDSTISETTRADCLVTATPHIALFLPIADCVGTVIYDPVHNVVALAHLGRHSSIAKLAQKTVTFLSAHYSSQPSDLIIWMAPSIQAPYYVLDLADFATDDPDWQTFCNPTDAGFSLNLQGYNRNLFERSGVMPTNIHTSSVNTANNSVYWSHFIETTHKKETPPPRFAVVAMLK